MRSNPVAYRLTFLLPDASPAPAEGARLPDERGCVVEIHPASLVQVCGPWREAVLDRAACFLRATINVAEPRAIAAVMAGPGGRDSWSIILGTDVAFSPTALPPHMPERPARPPPVLHLVHGGARQQGKKAGDDQRREPAGA